MSLLDSIKKGLMGEGDEYEDQYIDDGPQMVNNNSGVGIGMDEETEEPAEGTSKKNKVVNIHATTQLKVVLVKPERFEDASTIADHLNNKRTVVLNLESTNKEVSRRLVDFFVRRGLRQQRPDQARSQQYLYHYPVQRGYHGRLAGRAGEQWRILLIRQPVRCGVLCPPATMRNATLCGISRILPMRLFPAA